MSWMTDSDIMREQERQQLEHETWLRYYYDHEGEPTKKEQSHE